MGTPWHRFILVLLVVLGFLPGNDIARADDAAPAVVVKYSKHPCEFDPVKTEAKYYKNKDFTIKAFPDELAARGGGFSRHRWTLKRSPR